MYKRSVMVVLLVALAAAGISRYLPDRSAHKTVQLRPEVAGPEKTRGPAGASEVSAPPPSAYSESEYGLLRRRYKPKPPAAEGPVQGTQLELLEKVTQEALYQRESWPLIKDALSGNVTALRDALDTGVTANTTVYLMRPYNANVPLIDFAIQAGQRSVIELLLDHGAALSPAEYGTPAGGPFRTMAPLTLAAEYSEDDVIQLLLDHGADIEQRNDFDGDDSPALNAAVAGGSPSTVYLLLSKGADVNSALTPDGAVPGYLLNADATPGQIAVRELLIAHGARKPAGR